MDLNLISVFQVVADAATFSAAADKLGLRRSSISRSVAALEKELGVQLFNRTTRSVALTTAGTALLAKVRPSLLALNEALGSLPEREEEPSGELKLTAPGDIGAIVLPEILAGFTLRYPAVRVDVRLSSRMVNLVSEGFDAALRAGAQLKTSSLVARRLATLDFHIFAAPSYLARAGTPRSAHDAAIHDWVAYGGMKLPLPIERKAHITSDDMLFVHRAIRAGGGLGFIPAFLARADLEAGTLVRVLPKVESSIGNLYLVHPPAQHVPRKVTAFRDYLIQHLALHPLV